MKEYSRILIEQYCEKYPKTKKAATLQRLVTMSYDIASQPTDYDAISFEKLNSQRKIGNYSEKRFRAGRKPIWRN